MNSCILQEDPPDGDGTALVTRASDDGGLAYDGWSKARLVSLSNKGALPLARNWRGICLLEIDSKILPGIMVKRMQAFMEQVPFEIQARMRAAIERNPAVIRHGESGGSVGGAGGSSACLLTSWACLYGPMPALG